MSVVSFGGGVNSVAMTILLFRQRWRGTILFSDTGCEWPETYCYLDYFEGEWLRPRGLSITRISGWPWQRPEGGLPLLDYCERRHTFPMAAMRWCTTEWKIRPMDRYCKRVLGDTELLIGIAADEAHRRPTANRPLVDAGVDRAGCIAIIESEGLSVPLKSGCFICPFQGVARMRVLYDVHPDLFERVARLEESAPRDGEGHRRATLHPGGKYTLRDLEARFKAQEAFPEMDYGVSEYRPCLCEV